MYNKIGIISMARTPIGNFGGSLKGFSAADLASMVIKEAVARAGIEPEIVDEVLMGCVGQYGRNVFLGRLAAVKAGLADRVSAQTINRMCASGLQAIVTAADMIELGHISVAVAGGAESMSNYPYSLSDARWGMRMGNGQLQDDLLTALIEPFTGTHIAITAENIAEKFCFSREELDAFALESQEKAAKAIADKKFEEEILKLEVKERKEVRMFDADEFPRATSMEKLGKLHPAFKSDGVITAGNASGINDGAAALVLADLTKVSAKPLAKLVGWVVSGIDPNYMGLGPVPATRKLLKKTGLSIKDIGLAEINEAFAAQSLGCMKELELDPSIVNVNGGAIALGHPIGATGAIISMRLINEMRRRKARYGLVSLCIGGGQGLSAIFEVSGYEH